MLVGARHVVPTYEVIKCHLPFQHNQRSRSAHTPLPLRLDHLRVLGNGQRPVGHIRHAQRRHARPQLRNVVAFVQVQSRVRAVDIEHGRIKRAELARHTLHQLGHAPVDPHISRRVEQFPLPVDLNFQPRMFAAEIHHPQDES